MTNADFPDETLMRFVDGELDHDTSAEIERAMETDDELVSRVALFIETRAAARAALAPLLDEPVPMELTTAVEKMVAEKKLETAAPTVLPFPRRAGNSHAANRWALPIAASLAAVLGGFAGYWLAATGELSPPGLQVAGITSPALAEALATVASGEEVQLAESNQRLRVIATFRDNARALCREFEVDSADRSTVISVACHSDGEWQVSFAVAAAGDSTGYAPASSAEALDAYLSAVHAEPPMSTDEESRALSAIRSGNQK